MLRAIREIQPSYVVGENVLGLTNWNGGLVFEEVCADLEAEGYEVQPFILPAASVNAPHKRDRVWFIAHANRSNDGRTPGQDESEKGEKRVQERDAIREPIESGEVFGTVTDTNNRLRINEDKKLRSGRNSVKYSGDGAITHTPNNGLEHGTKSRGLSESKGETRIGTRGQSKAKGEISDATDTKSEQLERERRAFEKLDRKVRFRSSNPRNMQSTPWQNFPTEPPICGGDDGLPTELDGISFPKWRNESIKAYGNAIVPQVAFEIFKVINQMIENK